MESSEEILARTFQDITYPPDLETDLDHVQQPERVHLLVTDVVMPQMSGTELATRVRVFRRGLKVLYISGYANDHAVHALELAHGEAFLQKPMTPAVLARRVRELLDEK